MKGGAWIYQRSFTVSMLTAGCGSGFHWFCELCGHAHMEAGLKSKLMASNPTVDSRKHLRRPLTLVNFWTRSAYMCMRAGRANYLWAQGWQHHWVYMLVAL